MVVTVVMQSVLLIKDWYTSTNAVTESIHPLSRHSSSGWLEDEVKVEDEGASSGTEGKTCDPL